MHCVIQIIFIFKVIIDERLKVEFYKNYILIMDYFSTFKHNFLWIFSHVNFHLKFLAQKNEEIMKYTCTLKILFSYHLLFGFNVQ